MKKNDKVILFIVVGLVIGLIVLLFVIKPFNGDDHFNWNENYYSGSDEPYGTSVVAELLDGYFDDHSLEIVKNNVREKLDDKTGGHKNYVFIGWQPYITDSMFHSLVDFVERGNDAFLAVKEIPRELSEGIFINANSHVDVDSSFYTTAYGDTIWYQKPVYSFDSTMYSYFMSTSMTLNLIPAEFQRDTGWSFQFRDYDDVALYDWRYFVPSYVNKLNSFDSLGSMRSSNFLNYIRIPYGKGNFYIHLTPIVFTNYYQVEEKNIEYTSKIFSFLKPGDFIWDEASRIPERGNSGFDFNSEQEGPLRYILSQQSLRWSWYVLLSGLLIFLFFRSKRTQRAIPVMEANENKSLEFIQTIGRMYYISKNHKLMAQQKMKLFLNFISQRYRIPSNEVNDEFINKVNLKSEIPVSDIKGIFSHYRYIENTADVTADDLIYLHQLLDSFYKTCK